MKNKSLIKLSAILLLAITKNSFAQVYVSPNVPYQIWNPTPGVFISTPNPVAAGIVTAGSVFANGINKGINNVIRPNQPTSTMNNSSTNQITPEQQKEIIEKNQQKANQIIQKIIQENPMKNNEVNDKKPLNILNNNILINQKPQENSIKPKIIVVKGMGNWNESSINQYSKQGQEKTIKEYEKFLQK
jgi:hypothetical protein